MNQCNERHNPTYKIKYKPTELGGITNEWLVCENCFGKKEFFGKAQEIESITSLHNYDEIRLEVDHLSIMTNTVTKKLKNILLLN